MPRVLFEKLVAPQYKTNVCVLVHRQTVECNQPIEVVSYKIGVCKVSSKGKSCSTTFQLVGYNEKTNISVVLCFPHSGRMHQIRVHLQYLGNFFTSIFPYGTRTRNAADTGPRDTMASRNYYDVDKHWRSSQRRGMYRGLAAHAFEIYPPMSA